MFESLLSLQKWGAVLWEGDTVMVFVALDFGDDCI